MVRPEELLTCNSAPLIPKPGKANPFSAGFRTALALESAEKSNVSHGKIALILEVFSQVNSLDFSAVFWL